MSQAQYNLSTKTDYVNRKNGDSYEVDGVTYTMNGYISGYGYLEVTDKGKGFIKVEDWRSEKVGGKRKTRRVIKNKKIYKKTHKRVKV